MERINAATRIPTIGEYRVGVDFNPSGDPRVADIKAKAAALIDAIDQLDVSETGGEAVRLKALGMTNAEDAAMWGVKAATKKPPLTPSVPFPDQPARV